MIAAQVQCLADEGQRIAVEMQLVAPGGFGLGQFHVLVVAIDQRALCRLHQPFVALQSLGATAAAVAAAATAEKMAGLLHDGFADVPATGLVYHRAAAEVTAGSGLARWGFALGCVVVWAADGCYAAQAVCHVAAKVHSVAGSVAGCG
jgi:hypothetical protein